MLKTINLCFSLFFIVLLMSCSTTKYLTDEQYLLNNVKLESEAGDIDKPKLLSYSRQMPNDPKIRLWIYNLSNGDTTKWLKRTVRKMGEAPIIYSPRETELSIKQMEKELFNIGYFNGKVDKKIDTLDRKINLTYLVKPDTVYTIRSFKNEPRIDSILSRNGQRRRNSSSKKNNKNAYGNSSADNNRQGSRIGNFFRTRPDIKVNMEGLEKQRQNVATRLHNRGYYTLGEPSLYYTIDSSLNNRKADIVLHLRDSITPKPYRIRNVKVLSGYDLLGEETFITKDSLNYKGMNILYDKSRFLRPRILFDNITIRENMLYSERRTSQTYTFLGMLNSVSRTSIQYVPDKDSLNRDTIPMDALVYITKGNIHDIKTGLEGTNKAGDFGIASNISYSHYNFFNGSETFNVKVRGAYEFVDNAEKLTNNYYEIGVSTSLMIPQSVIPFVGKTFNDKFNVYSQYLLSLNMQRRPEYHRNFFNFNLKYKLENERKDIIQTYDVIDINFVNMPYTDSTFRTYLNESVNSLTKFSYEDIFTVGIGYSVMFLNKNTGRFKRGSSAVRLGAEASGNIVNAIFKLAKGNKNQYDQYTLWGNPYAQYTKFDVDFAKTIQLSRKNSLAMHFAGGVAIPYGNSVIMPFEKRYFSGGPSGVRGWNTRLLGPGRYAPKDRHINSVATHVGDIKLDASVEFRHKAISWLEIAPFVDAGNIWTIRNYENQSGGVITSKFYEEIAIGAGVGFRIDLSFLIVRLDFAKKVYDPSFVGSRPWITFDSFSKNNSAFYFAIGYPF